MTAKKNTRYGISLRLVIIVMFIIGIVVSFLLMASMSRTSDQYNEMEAATQDYVDCQNSVYVISDAINDLSEHAQNFVVTGNAEEAILYFNEVQVQNTRNAALEDIRSHLVDEQTLKHLDTALQLSERLMTTQWYAMRLAIEAFEYNVEKYPSSLKTVELSEADLALSHEEQLDKSRSMLFEKSYTMIKGQVEVRIDLCKNALVAAMQQRHEDTSSLLEQLLEEQQRLILAMVITLLLVLIFVLSLVVYPLYRLISSIRDGVSIRIRGASEIKFLAVTYNKMHDEMEDANSKLGYEATHDALTGLYNRSSYDDLRQEAAGRNIALLIVDVDKFKEVNDTYGHDVGDKVLIRVANVLNGSFREADKVCRIGGDEFSVIMMNVTSSVTEVLRKKIEAASKILKMPEEGIPPVTISVGVAFSDQLKPEESLFKNADRALYQVKENGRDGCGFYPDCITQENLEGLEGRDNP